MDFTIEIIEQVWEKAVVVHERDAAVYRLDRFKTWIYKPDYRNGHSQFGWDIVRIDPDKGDNIDNLIPLNFKNIPKQ